MDSHDVRGAPEEFSLADQERPSKKGKTRRESKTDDIAHAILEEDNDLPVEKTPATLKRERNEDEPVGTTETKKTKEKTKAVQRRIIPYRSHFPKETDLLVKDVQDIATQNEIKKAADLLFQSVTDNKIRQGIIALAMELPPHQKGPFIERLVFYKEYLPLILKFLATITPEERIGVMDELKRFLPDIAFQLIMSIPKKGLLETITVINSLYKEETDNYTKRILIDIINGIQKMNTGDCIVQLKPLLEGIEDKRVLLAVLKIFAGEYERHGPINPKAMQKIITETKNLLPLLNTVVKFLENKTSALQIPHETAMFLELISLMPSEKRQAAMEVAAHILAADVTYGETALDGEFITSITIEQVNTGIKHMENFKEDHIKTFEIKDQFQSDRIFKILAKVPAEQYDDVVQKLLLFQCYNSIEFLSYKHLEAIAATPPNLRGKFITLTQDLLKCIPKPKPNDCLHIYNALLQIQDYHDIIINRILPLLERPLTVEEISSLLSYASKSDPQVAELLIGQTSNFLKRAIEITYEEFTLRKNTSKILIVIENTVPEERKDVLDRVLNILSNFSKSFGSINNITALIHAISQIPHDQRESIVTYTNQLLEGIEYTGDGMADIIRALYSVEPSQRALVVEATLANKDQESDVDDILYFIDYYNSYVLEIPQEAIKEKPLELLAQISEQIAKKRATKIQLTFKGERGQDAGGLGRVFISDLFDALKIKLNFQQRETNGLYAPVAQGSLDEETKKAYRDMGRLLMFCLNATTDYPIGMIFEQSVFTGLTKLQEHHLNKPVEQLVEDKKTLHELCDIYVEMNRNDEGATGTLQWLQENKNDDDAQETIQGMLIDVFGPLLEIAKGMKDVPFTEVTMHDVQEMLPATLSEKLQGKVGKEQIIKALEFTPDIPEQIQQWVSNWITSADDKKCSEFIAAITGSPALGTKPIKITACEGEKTICHTCSNHLELAIGILTSQEQVDINLDGICGGGKFTMA